MGWIGEITKHVRNLLTQPTDELTRAQRSLVYAIDMARYAARTLHENRATQMAAALTYRTIFSLIPLFVLALIAFRAFGGFEEVGQNIQQRMYTYIGISSLAYDTGDAPATMTADQEDDALRERIDVIITDLTDRVAEVSFGSIGVVGVVLLIWAALALVVTVEHCFNTVYNAPQGRPWHLRIAIYWAVITLGPILLFVSLSLAGQLLRWGDVPGQQQKALEETIADAQMLGAMARSEGGDLADAHAALLAELTQETKPTAYVRKNLPAVEAAAEHMFEQWTAVADRYEDDAARTKLVNQIAQARGSFDDMIEQMKRREPIPGLAPVISLFSRAGALLASWLLLFLLYLLMPNARVALRPAAVGALTAAILWEFGKWGFNLYVTYAVPFSKVYGSLGLIPLFLFWLYLTWLIVLFGIEITYTMQTLPDFRKRQRQQKQQANVLAGNPLWLIPILTRIGQRFDDGDPCDVESLADNLGLPARGVADICAALEHRHLLHRVSDDDGMAYTLARSPRHVRMGELVELAAGLCHDEAEDLEESGKRSWQWLDQTLDEQAGRSADVTLADVIDRADTKPGVS